MNTQALKQLFELKAKVEFSKVGNEQNFYKKHKSAIFKAWNTLDILCLMINDKNTDYEMPAFCIEEQKNEFKKALSKI